MSWAWWGVCRQEVGWSPDSSHLASYQGLVLCETRGTRLNFSRLGFFACQVGIITVLISRGVVKAHQAGLRTWVIGGAL